MNRRSLLTAGLAATLLGVSLFCAAPAAHAVEYQELGELTLTKDVELPAIESRANTKDDEFSFLMRSVGNTSGTGYRDKDNDSSVYVRIDYTRGQPRMYVDGAYNDSGWGSRDCTATGYRVKHEGSQRLRNMVNEWGYNHARITTWADQYVSEVRGVWSPDCSSNTYPEMSGV